MAKVDKVKEAIDAAQDDLTTRFADIDATKTDVALQTSNVSNERKEFLEDETIKVVTNDYLKRHFPTYTGSTQAEIETFVRTKLTPEQQIAILAEFGINAKLRGENAIESRLQKVQDRRSDKRAEVKEMSQQLLADYKKALDDNTERINKVEASIAKLEAQLEKEKSRLGEMNLKDDSTAGTMARPGGTYNREDAVKKQKALISQIEKNIENKKRELAGLQKIQSAFEKEFAKRKTEIREFLRKENLYLNDNDKVEDKEKGDSEEEQKEKDESKSGSQGNANTKKDITKSMLLDFMDAPVERQRTLLRELGSEDIWKMTKNLSGFDRTRLRNILNQRLEERIDATTDATVKFKGIDIDKKKFKDMREMDEAELKAIRKEIDDFRNNYSHKTVDEIEDFEAKMDFVRLGTLIRETNRGFIRKFFGQLSRKETALSELGKSAYDYAERRGQIKSKKDDFHDSLRVIMKWDKVDEMERSGRQQLDKTGRSEYDHTSR